MSVKGFLEKINKGFTPNGSSLFGGVLLLMPEPQRQQLGRDLDPVELFEREVVGAAVGGEMMAGEPGVKKNHQERNSGSRLQLADA